MTHKKTKNLLFIEDDENTVKTVKTTLSCNGWRTMIAKTGEEALEKWEGFKPDLILLDLLLPVMDGFEVLRIIRQEKKYKGPIIIFSNLSTDKDIERGLSLGTNDYLIKSNISMKYLLEFLKKYC